jgi:hypothetical protein
MSTSRVLGLMIASAWLVAGCNGAKKIDVGGTCILNSDCGGSFVCTWGICHVACHASADCPKGQSCIIASVQSTVCQGPTPCTYNSDCQTGLICAVDRQCRQQCQKNVDCTNGQTCTTTNTCAEQSQVDSNKNLLVPDGGLGGTSGTSGAGGTGGSTSPGFDASPDLLADMSGSTGGTGGSAGGTSGVGGSSGTGGTGGAPGTGGSVGPNPDASPDLAADVPGSTGGVSSTGGILSTAGVASIRDALGAGGNTAAGGTASTAGTTAAGGTTNLPDAAADVNAGTTDAPTAPASPPSDGGMPDVAPPASDATEADGTVASSCGEIPSAGLVAYWGFEGLSDSDQLIPDLSGNGHTLTRGSTATADSSDPTFSTDTPCGRGSSAHLDGIDDFLWLPNDASLSPQELTLAAWAKLDVVPGNPACIAGNLGVWCSGNGYQLHFQDGDNLQAVYRGSGASCSNTIQAALSGFVWNPGQWHHVATTLQSTGAGTYEARLYIDGVLRSTATGAAVDYTNTPRFLIGTNADGVGLAKTHVREWPGNIDEVVVYNRALSASEVGQLAGIGVSP